MNWKTYKPVSLLAMLLVLWNVSAPAWAQTTDSMNRMVDEIRAHNRSLSDVLNELARQANFSVSFDPEVGRLPVDIELKGVTVGQACQIVCDRLHLGAVTNGKTMFVVPLPFDRISPESVATRMPVDASRQRKDVSPALAEATADLKKGALPSAERILSEALGECYGIDGEQSDVYKIVGQLQELYSARGLNPEQAVAQLHGDSFETAQLLRFYRRECVEEADFKQFKQTLAILNKVGDNFSSSDSQSFSRHSLSERLDSLENIIYGASSDDQGLEPRVEKLEKDVFGSAHRHEGLPDRIAALEREISSNANAGLAQSRSGTQSTTRGGTGNWFTNPPPVPWLNAAGRGLRNVGAAVTKVPEGVGHVVTSPLFWEAAVLGGAATGGYFLLRNNKLGLSSFASAENACVGETFCHHCTDCKYCRYCNTTVGKCGVFFSSRGMAYP